MEKHIEKRIQVLCKELYGRQVEVKGIPLPCAKGYYLTERGDLFIFRGKKPLGRVSKAKNDTIQIYENGKRVFWMVRRKLMMLTFKPYSLKMMENSFVFPRNGKGNDLRLSNLKVYESYSQGRRETYDDDFQGMKSGLQTRQVLEIRRAKGKFDRSYLAKKYGVSMRTITRIWNNHAHVFENLL